MNTICAMPRIIAICGAKRAGKDSIATLLQEMYGYEHLKISARLKEVTRLLFDFTADQVESETKDMIDPRWGTTPRRLMQFLGTEVMQYHIKEVLPGQERSFWIKSVIREIESTNKKYVISDLRFLHEATLLRSHGACILKVQRKFTGRPLDTHISELEYLDIKEDVSIYNSGSMLHLRNQVMDPLLFVRPKKDV